MEKTRICKICNRRFANGKAMGGHMRSHLAKLPLPPKPIPLQETNSQQKSLPSSSSLNYDLLSDKPMQYCSRSMKQEVSTVSKTNLATPCDIEESETESTRKPTRRRSKRSRKSADKVIESIAKVTESSEQVSSITYIFAEEDAALCLLMLSRDKWPEDAKQIRTEVRESVEDHHYVDEVESENEEEDDLFSFDTHAKYKSLGKYKCETCNKGFRSYQALGGHRASHKKMKINEEDEEDSGRGYGDNNGQRIFKCPFCEKAFDSGQALGGHKKVHFSYLPVTNAKISNDLLDLNLPAPEGTHDDGEVSDV